MKKISKKEILLFANRHKDILLAVIYILLLHALFHPQFKNVVGYVCYCSIFYLFCLIIALFLYFKKMKKIYLLFVFITFLVLCVNSISIYSRSNPIILPYSQSYYLTFTVSIESLAESFKHASAVIICFILSGVFASKTNGKKALLIFIILYGFLNILISFICNFNDYIYVFQNLNLYGSYRITSFPSIHSSGFGYILLISAIATLIFSNYIKNYKFQFCLIPFAVFTGFSGDKTAICLFIILLFVYYFLKLYFFIDKTFIRMLLITSVVLFIITSSLLVFLEGNPIHTFVFEKFNNFDSVKSRFRIWKNVILMLRNNPISLFFGYSYQIFNKCLNITYVHSPDFSDSPGINTGHNIFMDDLGTGGLIFLLIEIFFICYIFAKLYKNNIKNKYCIILGFLFIFIFFAQNLFVTYGILVHGYPLIKPIYYITIGLFINIQLPTNVVVQL